MLAHEKPTSVSAALTDTKVVLALGSSRPRGDRLKRACDLVLGSLMFVAALPVIAMIWAAVRATSSGPGFYSQVRVGLNGRNYRIFKIRTMLHNCEAKSGAQWCVRSDPRVTPLGGILRKLHLDELPQLWNVLRGDMSLVGPRPERPEFVGPLSEAIPGYQTRLQVRPGVTGLAQIQAPADTSLESVRTKLVLDHCYIERGGIWLDLRIMLGTVIYLAGFSYARVRRLLRLPNPLAEGSVRWNQPSGEPTAEECGRAARPSLETPTTPSHSIPCGKA